MDRSQAIKIVFALIAVVSGLIVALAHSGDSTPPATADTAVAPPPKPQLTARAGWAAGSRVDAVAFPAHDDDVLVVFTPDEVQWWPVPNVDRAAGEPIADTALRTSPLVDSVIDAVAFGSGLFSVHGGAEPTLVAWNGLRSPPSRAVRGAIPVEGQPMDLIADEERRLVRLLSRSDDGATVRTFRVGDDPEPEEFEPIAVGATSVGFFDSADGNVLVPDYNGRQVVVLSADPTSPPRTVTLDFRPLTAEALDDGRWLIAAVNLPKLAVLEGDTARSIELPAPLSLIHATPLGVYAFAASTGTLLRIAPATMNVIGTTNAFDLIVDLAWVPTPGADTEGALLALESGGQPQVLLLDPQTLQATASIAVPGRPASLDFVGDVGVVTSPNEGTISTFAITAAH